MRPEHKRRIPKLPGSGDKGAPLPAPSDTRFEFVPAELGRRTDNGWPITEARIKPWPTR